MNFKARIPQIGDRGPAGEQIIEKINVAPGAEDGNPGDIAVRYDDDGTTWLYGKKTEAGWPAVPRQLKGNTGDTGLRGWNPVLLPEEVAVKVDEGIFVSRILVKLAAWIGGQGTTPTVFVGQYVHANGEGFTDDVAFALDLRGSPGINGAMSGQEVLLDDDAAIGAGHRGKNIVVDASDTVELTLDEAELLGTGWMISVVNRGTGFVFLTTTGEEELDGPVFLGRGQGMLLWVNAAEDGFRSQIWASDLAPRVDLASGSTVSLAVAGSEYVRITGTANIVSFGEAPEGTLREVLFEGTLHLIGSSDILLPTDPSGAEIRTRPGDTALFRREATGWRCVRYSRGDASPLHGIRKGAIQVDSGTAHVIAGIPSWVRRIEINLTNIRKTGSQAPEVRIGNSGGLQDTGYAGGFGVISATPSANPVSSGIRLVTSSASGRRQGKIILTCVNFGAGIWSYHGSFWDAANVIGSVTAGTVVASGQLDRVGLVALDGAFDGDSDSRFQVSYEG